MLVNGESKSFCLLPIRETELLLPTAVSPPGREDAKKPLGLLVAQPACQITQSSRVKLKNLNVGP